VHGTGILYADDFTPSSVYRDGPRLRQQRALAASSSALAAAYAADEMTALERDDEAGSLALPFDCARQLFDLVSVSSSRLGLTAQPARVMGLKLDFARDQGKEPKYSTTLSLGGVA
jgi:hypothetical protein